MRPFELGLLIADGLGLLVLVSAARTSRLRYLVLAAPLAALAQLAFEGGRWQMAPAYGLAIAGAVIATRNPRLGERGPFDGLGAWTISGALLFMAALPPLLLPVFAFPSPGGPFAIGTTNYHWTDAAREDAFTPDLHRPRELMVQVWYPAEARPGARPAPYLPDPSILGPLARLLHLPGNLFGYLKFVRTHAVDGATAAAGHFPVLVFSHGRGGFRAENTAQVESLVSHGYVVAAIDHTYAASMVVFPRGRRVTMDPRMTEPPFVDRVIPYLARDVGFTLDRLTAVNRGDPRRILTGRLDLDRIGMFGMSLGGAVAADACRNDRRIRACMLMDMYMPSDIAAAGLRQPSLWLTRDAATMRREGWRESDVVKHQDTMRAAFAHSPDAWFVSAPGMFHPNFSDLPLAVPPPLGRWLGLLGPADARQGVALTNAVSVAFFDRTLKGNGAPIPDGSRAPLPGVVVEARRAGVAIPVSSP